MLHYNTIEIKRLANSNWRKSDIHLFERRLGQELLQKVEQRISESEAPVVIYLDFKQISSIDFSCADEFVGKLVSRLISDEYGEIYIVLQHLNENHQENIQVALDRRKVACLHRNSNETWNLMGYTKNYLVETLNIIMELGEITARQLGKKLNLELTTSSTRLFHLYKAHLVDRKQVNVNGGGREYIYYKLF